MSNRRALIEELPRVYVANNPMYNVPHSHEELDVIAGVTRPARVRTTPIDSILITIDSNKKEFGTNFDFTAKVDPGMRDAQTAYVSRVMIPKLPNINYNNNNVVIVSELGTYSGYIPPGYYNQVSLVNALSLVLNTESAGVNNFIVSYNSSNKTISVEATAGSSPAALFFFASNSSFIGYGINVVPFNSFPLSSDPAVVGSLIQRSGLLGLIYSRYVTLVSNRLCSNPVAAPRSSVRNNVISAISVAQHFDPQDYDPSGVFTGAIMVDQSTSDSSVLRVADNGKDLSVIDFAMYDEFGNPLAWAFDYGTGYASNKLGCLIYVTITF